MKSTVQHQRIQKAINQQANEIGSIQLMSQDTGQGKIQPVPAIYDSLVKVIHFTQTTRDSIRACENKISNLKFSLQECLDAYKEELAKEREEGETE